MSNKQNHRREGDKNHKRTEAGPRYESANPGAGATRTHVARARAWWKKKSNRWLRRTGNAGKFVGKRSRLHADELDEA